MKQAIKYPHKPIKVWVDGNEIDWYAGDWEAITHSTDGFTYNGSTVKTIRNRLIMFHAECTD